jgi:hypothetical protein
MKSVCMLICGSPNRDSRAQRTIRSIARLAEVDTLFQASPRKRNARVLNRAGMRRIFSPDKTEKIAEYLSALEVSKKLLGQLPP